MLRTILTMWCLFWLGMCAITAAHNHDIEHRGVAAAIFLSCFLIVAYLRWT